MHPVNSKYYLGHYITFVLIPGIDDPSGALSEAMTEKYFGYCLDAGTMGNWTEMIPGIIDVCIFTAIIFKL